MGEVGHHYQLLLLDGAGHPRKVDRLGEEKKTLVFRPSLPCGHKQTRKKKKPMKVNTDRQPGVGPLKRLTVNTDIFPRTPAIKPVPNVMNCILLNPVGTTEKRWAYVIWAARNFHVPPPSLTAKRTGFWPSRGRPLSREINGYLLILTQLRVCSLSNTQ